MNTMKKTINILFLTLIAASVSPALFAQGIPMELEGMVANSTSGAKQKVDVKEKQVVRFAPKNLRDPFLSREEVDTIEKARAAEEKRVSDERRKLEEAEKARRDAQLKQKEYEEELKRNPARAIIDKISIDGILGNEAIVNGEIKGIGADVMGAKLVSVSDNSVTFVYKGQRFVKKLPLI